MKNILTLFFSCIIFIVTGCKDESDVSSFVSEGEAVTKDIILQQRNPSLTHILSMSKIDLKASEEPTPLDHPYRYLGYTYQLGNCIESHPDNLRSQIVNIKAMYEDPVMNENTEIIPILDTDSKVSSYSSYNRFEKGSAMTKKVESGFQLNLGLFKFGRKKTVTEIFRSTSVNINDELTGEVNLLYLHSKVYFTNTSGTLKKIAASYVKPSFVYELYNTPIAEITEKLGPLVVTRYYSGGRANALYVADFEHKSDSSYRERDLDKHLNASFEWTSKTPQDKKDSVSINFGYKYKNGNHQITESKITNVHNRVKLSGGSPKLQLTTNVKLVGDNRVDLTPWFESLVDVKTHVVVDIPDEGLIGLDNFMLEENFKRRVRDSHMGYLTEMTYQEPYIEIVKIWIKNSSQGQLCDIAAVLTTRNGDKIVLSDGKAPTATDAELAKNNDATIFMQKAQAIKDQKSKFYQCEIRTNTSKIYRPYLRIPLVVDLEKNFDEKNVYKYTNPKTGITYIYDTKSRIAFSYLAEAEFIPWVYGTLDWFENVPEKSIPMSSLYQLFTIIGL